jgi:ribonuclease R
MTQDRFSRRILDHLADRRYQPLKDNELAHALGIPIAELDDFKHSIKKMLAAGQIVAGTSEVIALPPVGREMLGSFRLNERGFGFIVPDSPVQHGDLFVPAGSTGGAMTGDRVRARVVHEGARAGAGRSPFVGVIVEVVQRAEKRYVGNLAKRGSHFIVEVDGRVLQQPVIIRDPHAKNAKLGDKVVVELIEYPSENAPAEGVITEVLGEQGEPDIETTAVMRAYGLPDTFPKEVVDEARAAARTFGDGAPTADREDLTNDFILTIDPPDAKDYDDAISIEKLDPSAQPDNAHWQLGVHIADVSFFVKPGTALDEEAAKRGNSTYLPRKVIPMLPEMLSNGVCSLQEGVNRYCKSAFIRYDATGHVISDRLANTVIKSAKRLTYLEAQALIEADLREAKRHAKTEPKYSPQLTKKLQLMDELSKLIRERRFKQGMIVLGLPKVELVFDDSGRVIDAHPEDNAYTHTLIEMFMVEANEAAARLFNNLDIPMIRRVHADPDAHDIGELKRFARVAGYNIPSRPSRKELQYLLDSVRGKPSQHAVHIAVLKTLARAEYAPLLIGHFALASEHYTHFTSPIRRYADLIVHRGIDAWVEAVKGHQNPPKKEVARKMAKDQRVPSIEELTQTGQHISMTERNSQAAEDALRSYLVLDLLSEKLGEDFDGTVTGIVSAGVFIQIDKFLIDGFVKISDLPGLAEDRWKINHNTGSLVAQRSGKTVGIGDRFVVRIARVAPNARQMDLVIVGTPDPNAALPAKDPDGLPLPRKPKAPGGNVFTPQAPAKKGQGKPAKPGKGQPKRLIGLTTGKPGQSKRENGQQPGKKFQQNFKRRRGKGK